MLVISKLFLHPVCNKKFHQIWKYFNFFFQIIFLYQSEYFFKILPNFSKNLQNIRQISSKMKYIPKYLKFLKNPKILVRFFNFFVLIFSNLPQNLSEIFLKLVKIFLQPYLVNGFKKQKSVIEIVSENFVHSWVISKLNLEVFQIYSSTYFFIINPNISSRFYQIFQEFSKIFAKFLPKYLKFLKIPKHFLVLSSTFSRDL